MVKIVDSVFKFQWPEQDLQRFWENIQHFIINKEIYSFLCHEKLWKVKPPNRVCPKIIDIVWKKSMQEILPEAYSCWSECGILCISQVSCKIIAFGGSLNDRHGIFMIIWYWTCFNVCLVHTWVQITLPLPWVEYPYLIRTDLLIQSHDVHRWITNLPWWAWQ